MSLEAWVQEQPIPIELLENDNEDMPQAADIPPLLYYRVMIMPVRPIKKIGGILIPEAARDAQEIFNPYGRIVAIGESAFRSKKLSVDGSPLRLTPKVGEWVWYGRGAGAAIHYAGRKFVVVNEDAIICIIPDIEKVRRSV